MTQDQQQTKSALGVESAVQLFDLIDKLTAAFRDGNALKIPTWFEFKDSGAYTAIRDSFLDFTKRFRQDDFAAMVDELERRVQAIDAKAPSFEELEPEDQLQSLALDRALLRLRGKRVTIAFDRAWYDWLIENIFPLIEKTIPVLLKAVDIAL